MEINKILVTGGAGFIGSHTVDALINKGFKVRVLDNLQKPVHLYGIPDYINPKAEYIWGDVRIKSVFAEALKGIDAIFHFAAYQDYLTDFSTFFHVNSVGTALLYEIIVENNLPIKKLIIASSQFVQGEGIYIDSDGKNYSPTMRNNEQLKKGVWDFYNEKGEKLKWQWTNEEFSNPPNQYAISKYSQEIMGLRLGYRYEIPTVALRYSIVQGARQSLYNAYSGACRIFSLSYYFKKKPTIYEDGLMCRDFINIQDVIDANLIVLISEKADYNTFCVGGGKAYNIIEFAKAVASAYDCDDLVASIPGQYRFGDTRNACSDITKLRSLGWSPKKTIINSIQEYKEYLIKQRDIKDILDYTKKQMKHLNVVRSVN